MLFQLVSHILIVSLTEAISLLPKMNCGEHKVAAGEVLLIRGGNTSCRWYFQGPSEGVVEAYCTGIKIPVSKRCQTAALIVSTEDPNVAPRRHCGRHSVLIINKGRSSLNFHSHVDGSNNNIFKCHIYIRAKESLTAKCKCGQANHPDRIVGGNSSAVNQYPWVVGVTYRGMRRLFCGGVLVSDSHVLTAAHCMTGKKASKLWVVAAEHNWKDPNHTRITRFIKKIHYHKKFRPGFEGRADVAVLELKLPLPLSVTVPSVRTVCLPDSDAEDFAGQNGTVAGWGITNIHTDELANQLQVIQIPIWNNTECRKTGFGKKILKHMLCAGKMEGGLDACTGDSGAGLSIEKTGRHLLVGTVSFGFSCALPGWPGVYTRTSSFSSWIKGIIKSGITCEN